MKRLAIFALVLMPGFGVVSCGPAQPQDGRQNLLETVVDSSTVIPGAAGTAPPVSVTQTPFPDDFTSPPPATEAAEPSLLIPESGGAELPPLESGPGVYPVSLSNHPDGRTISGVAAGGDGSLWLRFSILDTWGARTDNPDLIGRIDGGQITYFSGEAQAVEAAWPWAGGASLWPVSPEGNIWFYGEDGLQGYDGSAWQYVDLLNVSDTIRLMDAGANNLIVVRGYDIHVYTPETGPQATSVEGMFPYFDNHDGWVDLLVGSNDDVWVSTGMYWSGEGNIHRYLRETNTWTRYDQPGENGVFYPAVMGLAEATDGVLWAAELDGTLSYYDAASDTWVAAVTATAETFGNAVDQVRFHDLFAGVDGDLWLVTSEPCGLFTEICHTGLVHYASGSWSFYAIGTDGSPLAGSRIFDVTPIDANSAWVATDAGLQLVTIGP